LSDLDPFGPNAFDPMMRERRPKLVLGRVAGQGLVAGRRAY
jgi:hypothetical protein